MRISEVFSSDNGFQRLAREKSGWLLPCRKPLSIKGFTLAELLIALAILGVITAFIIPKVLTSSSTDTTNATMKETIATVNSIIYDIAQSGLNTLPYTDPNASNRNNLIFSTFISKLNYVSMCNYPAYTNGCWSPDSDAIGYMGGSPDGAYILPNGAVIAYQGIGQGGSGGFSYPPYLGSVDI